MSKAAAKLGLSQPAVTAQIKRLQFLVGGELFQRSANGTKLTELGKLALLHARRIVESHDQLRRLGGSDRGSAYRLGISQLFADSLFADLSRLALSDLFIFAESSTEIRRGLAEGFVDVGCLFLPDGLEKETECRVIEQLHFEMSWIKAPDFVLRPGAPVPIITPADDNFIIAPLDQKGISYRIVLRSSDSAVRAAAVRRGLGISAMPSALVPADITRSKDYYLPALAPSRAVICVRHGLTVTDVDQLTGGLSNMLANLVV